MRINEIIYNKTAGKHICTSLAWIQFPQLGELIIGNGNDISPVLYIFALFQFEVYFDIF